MWDTRHNYGYLRRQFTYVRVAVLTNVILRIHDLVRWLEILVTFLPRYGKPEGIKNQGMWMIDIPYTRSRQTMAPGNAVQCDTSYFTGVRLWVGYQPVLEQYMVRSISTKGARLSSRRLCDTTEYWIVSFSTSVSVPTGVIAAAPDTEPVFSPAPEP